MSEELKPGAEEQDLRPAFTNGCLAFHTDVSDILSLFTMDVPNNGGETMIVSSCHLYNQFARTRPDMLHQLTEKWVSFSGANPTLPAPTEEGLEAMALVEDLACKHAMPLPGKPGDIACINNLCLMHARNAFDLDEKGKPLPSKRHLVQMMLQDPELKWELPDSLSWYSQRVYGPNQDGGRTEKWQLGIACDESLPDGHIWAGTGTLNNG
ncbi:hypothetical protein QQZ08_003742 [Neonectria magnoliae]|uniref:TauD/TfdA-like domain-containing protein n=1 Tax=Neonectria magnoliae TaxID=2732573 RepID=A0ABR1I858_9HYPO